MFELNERARSDSVWLLDAPISRRSLDCMKIGQASEVYVVVVVVVLVAVSKINRCTGDSIRNSECYIDYLFM